jgi:hypothetical protein
MVVAHPVPSAIVVHRNGDVNAPKVHCPKAGRNVEKQHQMMNPRAESVVGGTVGAHAKAHHHEARAAHDEQTKCSTANTEPTTTVRTAHVDSPPATRHMWPGKPSTDLFGCTCQYTDHNITSSLPYVIERQQHQMPIPRLLLMGRTVYEREHMAQSRRNRV